MARRFNSTIPEDYQAPLKYAAFHLEWLPIFEFLQDTDAAALARGIMQYVKFGKAPKLEGMAGAQFNSWREQIDADLERNRTLNYKREQRDQHNKDRRERRESIQEPGENGGNIKGESGKHKVESINDKSENHKSQNLKGVSEDASTNKGACIDAQTPNADAQARSVACACGGASNAPANACHIEDEDLDWTLEIDLSTSEKRRDFIAYMLWRLCVDCPVERYTKEMENVSKQPQADSMLLVTELYIYLDQDFSLGGSAEYDKAAKMFNKWKGLREGAGLPVCPQGWTCEIENLFRRFGIKQSDGVAFYDCSDYPRHTTNDALAWIAAVRFGGKKTPGELLADMEKEASEEEAARIAQIPNDAISQHRQEIARYCKIKGYTRVDIDAVLRTDITKTHWTHFVEVCERNAKEKEEATAE